MARAGFNAGRLLAPGHAFRAQVTLLGYPFLLRELYYAQRTGIKAIFTSITKPFFNQNNAIRSFGNGIYGAGIPARRLGTMQAVSNPVPQLLFSFQEARNISIDPYPSRADRQVMRLLAGYLAGMTSDAVGGVDQKRQFFSH